MADHRHGADSREGVPVRSVPERAKSAAILAASCAAFGLADALGSPPSDDASVLLHLAGLAMRLAILCFIIVREGGFAAAGLSRPRPRDAADAVTALVALLLVAFAVSAVAAVADPAGGPPRRLPFHRTAPAAQTILVAIASAWYEESLYRGFFLSLAGRAGLPAVPAIAASVALFSLGHAWQGAPGIATAAFAGLFLCLLRRGGASTHALAAGHLAYNLLALFAG
jgi:membrane protease YdiL (CAAX protease family)